ncbi:hypothetical protein [Methylomonas sp. CM2]|uniref:hypothetical protein n=1 Tax=Methylomonas sp. CM2 TaxID=3417647 RepID=UPI003CF6FA33
MSSCVVDRRRPEGCLCYTQQATPYFVSPDQCRAYIKYGRFDPYRDTPASVAQAASGRETRAEPAASRPPAS